MFSKRERVRFFHPDRSLQSIFGTAATMASARKPDMADGTSSLDFLIAATDAGPVAKLLKKLGIDLPTLLRRANDARGPASQPGLTPDAKLVAEAVAQRALDRQRDMKSIDLLVALATVPGPAHELLFEAGLDQHLLAALVA